ncbi:hypothetical protein COCVIDRAFT_91918 [Bipolaris victoriae FI3]|uniref:Uncharacterized protein n=2 Tax=Bipolaris TaxID=33194 RepID=W6Y1T6_COCC2|nr:uncharacterized protein COCCADRAFT_100141 [Bipolaris zeicola 26-R-13]XP_014559407.1 hypothetical protein COCVIDRAFT_91918 [Bipolaris victoriae FI3]EUC31863.1 hypothetical protein COCCADRAFT_100141 [Bipolaris zeicola 26-R-13]
MRISILNRLTALRSHAVSLICARSISYDRYSNRYETASEIFQIPFTKTLRQTPIAMMHLVDRHGMVFMQA